jgi:hypothetical protein
METALLDEPMAKAKGRPRKSSGEGTLVRIDSDIVNRSRYLSAQLGTPISELLSGFLRPEIDRLFRKVTREVLEAEKAKDAAVEQQALETKDTFSATASPPKGKRKGSK